MKHAFMEPALKCKGCGEPTLLDDRLHFYGHDKFQTDSSYCGYCREKCPICQDWLKGEDEVEINGQRCHKVCADEQVAESRDAA